MNEINSHDSISASVAREEEPEGEIIYTHVMRVRE